MRVMKKTLCFLLTVILFVAVCERVHAGEIKTEYSADLPCSINLVMHDSATGETVAGGTLVLYRVGDPFLQNGNIHFALTDAFSGSGLSLDDTNDAALAAALLQYAEASSLKGEIAEVSSNGEVSFTDLNAGLYLIAANDPPRGYCEVAPFLIDLPHGTETGWDYDPFAEPKMNAAARLDPPIEKVLEEIRGKAQDKTFIFSLTPDSADTPMPDPALYTEETGEPASIESSTGKMCIQKTGEGETEFGWIYYDQDDTGKVYTYTVAEEKGNAEGYKYDDTVYVMTVRVENDETGMVFLNVSLADAQGRIIHETTGSVIEGTDIQMRFTNQYTEPDKPPVLPQTGQLWWPVWVLSIVGILMIAIGVILRKRSAR